MLSDRNWNFLVWDLRLEKFHNRKFTISFPLTLGGVWKDRGCRGKETKGAPPPWFPCFPPAHSRRASAESDPHGVPAMSRHKHDRRMTAPQTRRKIENLRDGLTIARARRYLDRARQFVLQPSKMEFDYDFTSPHSEEYSRVDGRPAIVGQVPRNANNMHMQESPLSEAVHDYFQDRPELVSECVRRYRRRRVLFALHRTQKGSGAGRKHKWTELSKVRCV